jgi:D-arabinose 1-dehydrogenase-like Zn-dependent alcohol dehydrogenase
MAHFAIPIPDDMKAEDCAPLLCAGITTYSPLKAAGVKPGMKVGVLGVGGLGHIAIRLAVAMGAHVTAISHSPDKRELSLKALGAHEFINSSSKEDMKKAQKSLDLLLNTVSVAVAWDPFLGLLKPGKGRFHSVSAPEAPGNVTISANRLLQGLSVSGSSIGSPGEIREMLDFCGKHKITCMTEVMPFAKITEAIEKVRANQARFRVVLAMPPITAKL